MGITHYESLNIIAKEKVWRQKKDLWALCFLPLLAELAYSYEWELFGERRAMALALRLNPFDPSPPEPTPFQWLSLLWNVTLVVRLGSSNPTLIYFVTVKPRKKQRISQSIQLNVKNDHYHRQQRFHPKHRKNSYATKFFFVFIWLTLINGNLWVFKMNKYTGEK